MKANTSPPNIVGIPKDKVKKILRQSKNVNNIVAFPKEKIVRHHTAKDGFGEKLIEQKVTYVNFIVDKHLKVLYNQMSNEGIDTESQNFYHDYIFVAEALKAALYRANELPHPMQKLMDQHQSVMKKVEEINEAKKQKKVPLANT